MFNSIDTHLAAVESLMQRLSIGDMREIIGEVAVNHLNGGGKRLRARLALAATEALGGKAEDAVGWAAACELLHNATLVHDDLQDGDKLRRGKPTVWVEHGMAHAINAGDLLLMLPFTAVEHATVSDGVRWHLCRVIADRATAVIRGQAAEMIINDACDADRQKYIAAITGKTSALFELPVEGAALIAGRDAAVAKRLAAPFRQLGMLFQMQDDILDLYGDKGRNAVGSDLREGKISALVVEHLALHPDDAPWLKTILQTDRQATADSDVAMAIAKMRDGGALGAVREHIRTITTRLKNADDLSDEPQLAALINELVDVILQPIAHVMD